MPELLGRLKSMKSLITYSWDGVAGTTIQRLDILRGTLHMSRFH